VATINIRTMAAKAGLSAGFMVGDLGFPARILPKRVG
jgi:hypothetical protein